jgi:hypothetical protein
MLMMLIMILRNDRRSAFAGCAVWCISDLLVLLLLLLLPLSEHGGG